MKAKNNKEAKSYCKSLEILPTKGNKKIQNLNTQTNTVAVEISRSPKNDMSYQIVSRYTLGKFAEFGVHCIAYMLLKPQVFKIGMGLRSHPAMVKTLDRYCRVVSPSI